MLTTYTLDTLLAKFEVGAKPRARDPPAIAYCTSVAASGEVKEEEEELGVPAW